MCDEEGAIKRKVFYVSPWGTVETPTPESLEGDRDYVKDLPKYPRIILPDWGYDDE